MFIILKNLSSILFGIYMLNVQVPTGVFPSGTKNISSNGSYDVYSWDKVNVQVSASISVSGVSKSGSGGKIRTFSADIGHCYLIWDKLESNLNNLSITGASVLKSASYGNQRVDRIIIVQATSSTVEITIARNNETCINTVEIWKLT